MTTESEETRCARIAAQFMQARTDDPELARDNLAYLIRRERHQARCEVLDRLENTLEEFRR